jgi:hypothetical protein
MMPRRPRPARWPQHQRPVMRTAETQDDPFGGAMHGVVPLDRVEQLVPAELGLPQPEIAARHDDDGPLPRRVDHFTQRIVGVQANDDVVISRHIGAVFFDSARNSAKNPAARVHDVAINVVSLTEPPRQHSLPACNIGRTPGLRKPGGDEVGRHFESPLITVKPVCRHCRTSGSDICVLGTLTNRPRRMAAQHEKEFLVSAGPPLGRGVQSDRQTRDESLGWATVRGLIRRERIHPDRQVCLFRRMPPGLIGRLNSRAS